MKKWDRQNFFFAQLIKWYHRAQLVVPILMGYMTNKCQKTPNGVSLLLDQYCSRQILKLSMRPKVLRKLYPGIGTLNNASGLLDLRELAGWDRCLLLLHSFAQADLEEMMSKKGTRVLGSVRCYRSQYT